MTYAEGAVRTPGNFLENIRQPYGGSAPFAWGWAPPGSHGLWHTIPASFLFYKRGCPFWYWRGKNGRKKPYLSGRTLDVFIDPDVEEATALQVIT